MARPTIASGQASIELVREGYFHTQGVGVLRGRDFTSADIHGRRRVAIVNERLVARHLGGGDPIGRSVTLRLHVDGGENVVQTFEIVGVVADARNRGVIDPTDPGIYLPSSAAPAGFSQGVIVRAAASPAAVLPSIKREIWAIDRAIAISDAQPLDDLMQRFEYARPKLGLFVFSAFAAVGLVLVVLGVASLIAYTIARQRREIGIRLAIGASRGDVLRLTFGMGLRWLVYGVGIGLAGSLAATRVLTGQLVDVSPTDPLTIALVVAVIALTGVIASYLPARRALRIDPIAVLRSE